MGDELGEQLREVRTFCQFRLRVPDGAPAFPAIEQQRAGSLKVQGIFRRSSPSLKGLDFGRVGTKTRPKILVLFDIFG